MRLALVLLALAACSRHRDEPDHARAQQLYDEVPLPNIAPGESDLTLDDRGHLWTIAERDPVVTELELGTTSAKMTPHDLVGVPQGLDTEAITWLGDRKFAIGTEGQQTPTASVLFAELGADGQITVVRERPLTTAEMGVELTKNHGAEGICGKGDELLVAIETVGKLPDGMRWAPLVHFKGGETSLIRFRLTTKEGKISALSCTFAADGTIDILAIERHYGVSRILHAVAAPGATELTPTVELDLFPVNKDRFNLEGLVRLPDGRWVAINDNQGSHVEGETELLVFHPR